MEVGLGARRVASRIAALYALAAGAWILISDRLSLFVADDLSSLNRVDTVKGACFVAVTMLLLYGLVRRLLADVEASQKMQLDTLRLLESLTESSTDAIFAKDLQGRYLVFNAASGRLVGRSPAEVLGRHDGALSLPPQALSLLAAEAQAVADGFVDSQEQTITTPEGEKSLLVTRGPLRDAAGAVCGSFGIARDITARKRRDAEIRYGETRYHALIDQATPDAMFVHDHDGHFIEVNRRACETLGYTREELLRMTVMDVETDFDLSQAQAEWSCIEEGGVTRRMFGRHRRRDGTSFPVELSFGLHVAQGQRLYIVFVRDITEWLAHEAALKASRQRFQDIVGVSADWVWEVDPTGRYTYVSASVAPVLGYAPGELVGRSFLDLLTPAEAARVRDYFAAVGAARGTFRDVEILRLRKDGDLRCVQTSGVPIIDEQGVYRGYRGLERDITERRQADAQRRLLSQVITQSPMAVVITDAARRITFVNDAFCRITGYSREQAIGQPARMLGAEPGTTPALEELRDALAQGCPWEGELRNRRANGTVGIDYCRIAPVRDEHGHVTNFVSVQEDITGQRKLTEELELHRNQLEDLVAQRSSELAAAEQRLRLVVESLAEGIIELDADGVILMINPATTELLGFTAEELVGRNVHVAIHHSVNDGGPDAPESCALLAAVREGRKCQLLNDSFWHRDGHPVPVAAASNPILAEWGVAGAVLSFFDITERQRADEAREQARQAAEQLARIKGEFLANMSHEIRTPLNGVLGLAQIGYRDSAGREQARQTFGRILDSGRLLLTIINDILDFSKIEAGKLEVESVPLDPGQLVEEAAGLLGDGAAARQLRLAVEKADDLPAACLGDPVRISQILLNLLSNAVKFTPAGEVRLSACREGEELVFRVADSGIGIAPADQQRLFSAFEQADGSTTRKYGGTGLGLTISRRLAELMGGSLGVRSEPGVGSTFELRLPLHESDAAVTRGGSTAGVAGSRLAGLRILAAEDNEVNALVLEDFLRREGADVELVGNGRLAVEAVERSVRPFDLVLMDVQMPEMDGLEATRRLRRLAPTLPVVGQTAHAMKEEHERCIAAGMAATITKPLDIDVLVSNVLQQVHAPTPPTPTGAAAVKDEEVEAGPVDWAVLGSRFPNRDAFIDRLVALTIAGNAALPARLRALADACDLDGIREVAHALKGVAGNLAAMDLERRATRTLLAAQAGDPGAQGLARQLADALERLLDALRAGRPR